MPPGYLFAAMALLTHVLLDFGRHIVQVEAGGSHLLDCDLPTFAIPSNTSSHYDSPDEYYITDCLDRTIDKECILSSAQNVILWVVQSSLNSIVVAGGSANVTVCLLGNRTYNASIGVIVVEGQSLHTALNITLRNVQMGGNANSLIYASPGSTFAGSLAVAASGVTLPDASGVFRLECATLVEGCGVAIGVDGVRDFTSLPLPSNPVDFITTSIVWLGNITSATGSAVLIKVSDVDVYKKESLVAVYNSASAHVGTHIVVQDVRCRFSCAVMRDENNTFVNLTLLVRNAAITSASTRARGAVIGFVVVVGSVHEGTVIDVRHSRLKSQAFRLGDPVCGFTVTASSMRGCVLFLDNTTLSSNHTSSTEPGTTPTYSSSSVGLSLKALQRGPTQLLESSETLVGDTSPLLLVEAEDPSARSLLTNPAGIGVAVVIMRSISQNGGFSLSASVAISVRTSLDTGAIVWTHNSTLSVTCGTGNSVCSAIAVAPLDQSHSSMATLNIVASRTIMRATSASPTQMIIVTSIQVSNVSIYVTNGSVMNLLATGNSAVAGILCKDLMNVQHCNITLDAYSLIRIASTTANSTSSQLGVGVFSSVGVTQRWTDALARIPLKFYINVVDAAIYIDAPGALGYSLGVALCNVTHVVVLPSANPPPLWSSTINAAALTYAGVSNCSVLSLSSREVSCAVVQDAMPGLVASPYEPVTDWLDGILSNTSFVLIGRTVAVSVLDGPRLDVGGSNATNAMRYAIAYLADLCAVCEGPGKVLGILAQRGVPVQAAYSSWNVVVVGATLSHGLLVRAHGDDCGGSVGAAVRLSSSHVGNGISVEHAHSSGLCPVPSAANTPLPPYPAPALSSQCTHYNTTLLVENVTQIGNPDPAFSTYYSWILVVPQYLDSANNVWYDGLTITLRGMPAPVIQTAYTMVALAAVTLSSSTSIEVDSVSVGSVVPLDTFPSYGRCGAVGLLNVAQSALPAVDFATTRPRITVQVRNTTLAGFGQIVSNGVFVGILAQASGATVDVLVEDCHWTTASYGVHIELGGSTLSDVTVVVSRTMMNATDASALVLSGWAPGMSTVIQRVLVDISDSSLVAGTSVEKPGCVWLSAHSIQDVALRVTRSNVSALGLRAATTLWVNCGIIARNVSILVSNKSILVGAQVAALSMTTFAGLGEGDPIGTVEDVLLHVEGHARLVMATAQPDQLLLHRRGVWISGRNVVRATVRVEDATVELLGGSNSTAGSWHIIDVLGTTTNLSSAVIRDVNLSVVRCTVNIRAYHSASGSGLVWLGSTQVLEATSVLVEDCVVNVTLIVHIQFPPSLQVVAALDGTMLHAVLPPTTADSVNISVTGSTIYISDVMSGGIISVSPSSASAGAVVTGLHLFTSACQFHVLCELGACYYVHLQGSLHLLHSAVRLTGVDSSTLSNPTPLTSNASGCVVQATRVDMTSSVVAFSNVHVSLLLSANGLPQIDAVALHWSSSVMTETLMDVRGTTTLSGAVIFSFGAWSHSMFFVQGQGAILGGSITLHRMHIDNASAVVVAGFEYPSDAPSTAAAISAVTALCVDGNATVWPMEAAPPDITYALIEVRESNLLRGAFIGLCDYHFRTLRSSSRSGLLRLAGDALVNVTQTHIVMRNVTAVRGKTTTASIVFVDAATTARSAGCRWADVNITIRNVTVGSPEEAQSTNGVLSCMVWLGTSSWVQGSLVVDGLLFRPSYPEYGGGILWATNTTNLQHIAVHLRHSVIAVPNLLLLLGSTFSDGSIVITQSRFVSASRLRIVEALIDSAIRNTPIVWDNTGGPPPSISWMSSIDYVAPNMRSVFAWTDASLSILDRWATVFESSTVNVSWTVRNVNCVLMRFGIFVNNGTHALMSVLVDRCSIRLVNGSLLPVENIASLEYYRAVITACHITFTPSSSDDVLSMTVWIASYSAGLRYVSISVVGCVVKFLPVRYSTPPTSLYRVFSIIFVAYVGISDARIEIQNTSMRIGNSTEDVRTIVFPPSAEAVSMVFFYRVLSRMMNVTIIVSNVTFGLSNAIAAGGSVVSLVGLLCVQCTLTIQALTLDIDTRSLGSFPPIFEQLFALLVLGQKPRGEETVVQGSVIFVSCSVCNIFLPSKAPAVASLTTFAGLMAASNATLVASRVSLVAQSVSMEGNFATVMYMDAATLSRATVEVLGLPHVVVTCCAQCSVFPPCGLLFLSTLGANVQHRTVPTSLILPASAFTPNIIDDDSVVLLRDVSLQGTIPPAVVVGGLTVRGRSQIVLQNLNLSLVGSLATNTTCTTMSSTTAAALSSDNVLLVCSMIYVAAIDIRGNSVVSVDGIMLHNPNGSSLRMMPLGLYGIRMSRASLRVGSLMVTKETGGLAAAFRCVAITVANTSTLALTGWNLSAAVLQSPSLFNVTAIDSDATLELSDLSGWRMVASTNEAMGALGCIWMRRVQITLVSRLQLFNVEAVGEYRHTDGSNAVAASVLLLHDVALSFMSSVIIIEADFSANFSSAASTTSSSIAAVYMTEVTAVQFSSVTTSNSRYTSSSDRLIPAASVTLSQASFASTSRLSMRNTSLVSISNGSSAYGLLLQSLTMSDSTVSVEATDCSLRSGLLDASLVGVLYPTLQNAELTIRLTSLSVNATMGVASMLSVVSRTISTFVKVVATVTDASMVVLAPAGSLPTAGSVDVVLVDGVRSIQFNLNLQNVTVRQHTQAAMRSNVSFYTIAMLSFLRSYVSYSNVMLSSCELVDVPGMAAPPVAQWAVVRLEETDVASSNISLTNIATVGGSLYCSRSRAIDTAVVVVGGKHGGCSLLTLGESVSLRSNWTIRDSTTTVVPSDAGPQPRGLFLDASSVEVSASQFVLQGAFTQDTGHNGPAERLWLSMANRSSVEASTLSLSTVSSKRVGLLVSSPECTFVRSHVRVQGSVLAIPATTGFVQGGTWREGSEVQVINCTIEGGGVMFNSSSFADSSRVVFAQSTVLVEPAVHWWRETSAGGASASTPLLRIYCSTGSWDVQGTSLYPIRSLRHVFRHLYFISPVQLSNQSIPCPAYALSESLSASWAHSASTTRFVTQSEDSASPSRSVSGQTHTTEITLTDCPLLEASGVHPSLPNLYAVFTGAVQNITIYWDSVDGRSPSRLSDVRVRSSWGSLRPTKLLRFTNRSGALELRVEDVPVVKSFLSDVDVVMDIDVFAYCSSPTATLRLQRTVLPTPQAARTAGEAAAVVGALGAVAGIGVGGAMQRSMLLLQLSVCEFSLAARVPISDSPTQMGFGVEENYYIRGAVVGNLLLLVGFAAATVVGTEVFSRIAEHRSAIYPFKWNTFVNAWATHARMPGVLMAPTSMFMQPMVANSLSLVVYPVSSYDPAIGVFGLLAMIGLSGLLVVKGLSLLGSGQHPPIVWRLAERRTKRMSLLRILVTPASGWVALDRRKGEGKLFLNRFGHVFEEFSFARRWFSILDLTMAFICGVVAALKPTTDAGCTGLTIALLVFAALYATAILALRPFNAMIGSINSVANAVSSVLCCAFILLEEETISDVVALSFVLLNLLMSLTGVIGFAFQLGLLKFADDDRQRPTHHRREEAARSEVQTELLEMPAAVPAVVSPLHPVSARWPRNVKGYARRPGPIPRPSTLAVDNITTAQQLRNGDGSLRMSAWLRPLDDVMGHDSSRRTNNAAQLLAVMQGPPKSQAERRRRLQLAIIAAASLVGTTEATRNVNTS